MNIIKKITVGTVTGIIALSSVTPAFAAKAVNRNIRNSFARAVAVENTTNVATVTNTNTVALSGNLVLANTGFNLQSFNQDDNSITSRGASALGTTSNSVNATVLTLK